MVTRTGEELRGGTVGKGTDVHLRVIFSSSNSFWRMIFHTTISMLFHNETVLLIVGDWALQFQRPEKCLPCLLSMYQFRYHVLIHGDADLITQNNVLGHCAVFPASDQCQAAHCLAFFNHLSSHRLRTYSCVSNIFWKKVNGTWAGAGRTADSPYGMQAPWRIQYLVPFQPGLSGLLTDTHFRLIFGNTVICFSVCMALSQNIKCT